MKKLFCFVLVLLSLASCKSEEHSISYGDMFYFTLDEDIEGVILPLTNLNSKPNSEIALIVMRTYIAASSYKKQTVTVIVDEELSTAVKGQDFDFSPTTLEFKDLNTRLPFKMNVNSAKNKTIVLKLDYGYQKECPPESRTSDRLKIQIK